MPARLTVRPCVTNKQKKRIILLFKVKITKPNQTSMNVLRLKLGSQLFFFFFRKEYVKERKGCQFKTSTFNYCYQNYNDRKMELLKLEPWITIELNS